MTKPKMTPYIREKYRATKEVVYRDTLNNRNINHKSDYGRTALHKAASCPFNEFVSDLVQKRADVNVQDNDGFTPLHFAITNDTSSAAKVKLLLVAGANPNLKSNSGETPLFWAARWGEGAIEAVIYEQGGLYGIDSFDAADRGNVKQLATMLAEAPALANAKVSDFHYPCEGCLLGLAIRWGQKEVTQFLISNGADINNIGSDGNAPLHVAAYWHQREIAELLIANGAQLNLQNSRGKTPLHVAVSQKDDAMVELLLGTRGNTAKGKNG